MIPSCRPERSFVAKLPSVATTVGSISAIWRKRWLSHASISSGCGSRLPGRPALQDVRDVDVARASCRCRASSFSSSFPAWPTNGTPCLSSWKPGASPTNIRSGVRIARAEHDLRAALREPAAGAAGNRFCVGLELVERLHRNGAHGTELYDERRMETIVARQEPRGASISTSSPSALPSTARPTGDSGETPPTLEISTVISSPSSRFRSTVGADGDDAARRRRVLVDHLGVLEPRAEDRDPPLEQPLLVLRRVVLEVLGEVAVTARRRDRLDDRLPLRPFELRELGLELLALRVRQLLAALFGHQWPQPHEPPQHPPPPPPPPKERRRLRHAVHGERRELPRHVGCGAVRAGDLLLAADELFEVRLALHADVFVDRHPP